MEDRPVMTDDDMIKDYPRLKLEYTRLHNDYRRLHQIMNSDVIKWVAVKDKPPPKGGIFIIYDNGIGEGLYHKNSGVWKSTDTPVKNSTGASVLRLTIKPLYWLDLNPPCL